MRADAAVIQTPVGADDGEQVPAKRLLDEREPDRLLLGAPRRFLLSRQVGHEEGFIYLPGSAALLFLGAGLGVFLLDVGLLLDWRHGEKIEGREGGAATERCLISWQRPTCALLPSRSVLQRIPRTLPTHSQLQVHACGLDACTGYDYIDELQCSEDTVPLHAPDLGSAQ